MPEEITEQITQFNLDLFTWDLFVIIAVLALACLWFYTKGRDFIVTTLLGTYVAAVTMMFAPLISNFYIDFGVEEYQFHFLFFLLLVAVCTWIMSMNGYFEPYVVPSSWEVPIFVILFSGLFLAVASYFIPEYTLYGFSPITRLLFSGDTVLTAWIGAPMIALVLIRGRA